MTVAEMIAMADQYPSSAAGMMRTNNKKLPFQKIVDSLSPTEEVVLAFGASAGSVGKTPYQIVAVVFTNERLLIAGRPNSLIGSFMEAGVKSIKIDKVNSIGVFVWTPLGTRTSPWAPMPRRFGPSCPPKFKKLWTSTRAPTALWARPSPT